MYSDKNSLSPVAALQNSTIATDTDTDGIIIDTQNARDVNILLQCNAFTDGTYTPTIRTSSDSGMSGATTIAAADINGDGRSDILAAIFARDEIVWFENSPLPPLEACCTPKLECENLTFTDCLSRGGKPTIGTTCPLNENPCRPGSCYEVQDEPVCDDAECMK